MGESKHTPGPWAVRGACEIVGHGPALPIGGGEPVAGTTLAFVGYAPGDGADKKTAEANARLIAAAPDLLDALEEAVQHCGCTIAQRESGHLVGCWAPPALAAIASATGGER